MYVLRSLLSRCARTPRRSRLLLHPRLERLEDRTVPTGWSKLASADGFVSDNNRDGTFDSINTTATSDQTTLVSSLPEDRTILEFYIGDIPRNTVITSARILGNVNLMQYNSNDGGVDVAFHGYVGNGSVNTTDGQTPANQVGLYTDAVLGEFAVAIAPSFIQSLLNAPTNVLYVGFSIRMARGQAFRISSSRQTFALKPTLQINYDQNTTPTAVDDSYSVDEESSLSIAAPGILGNDIDPDGDALNSIYVTGPNHASSFGFITNGAFNYTPMPNFSGIDTFTYKVTDGIGTSSVGTVSINVRNINDAPVAWPDNYTIGQDKTLTVSAPGVLTNDVDPDGDSLLATLVSQPANGTLTFNNDGSLSYTPNAGFRGQDRFTYKVNDGTVDSNSATVTITVNDAPVANNDSYSTNEDTTLTVAAPGVLSNDTDLNGDTLTATRITNPTNGTLTFNSNGSFTYIPQANFFGTDSFTYRVSDGRTNSVTNATVNLTINPVNDPPISLSDSYAVNTGGTLTIAAAGVLTNDSDPEGNPLTAVLGTGPTHGTLTLNPDGSFTYVPTAGYVGSDSFTYAANDGTASSNPATVTIKVNGAPVAVNDSYTISEDGLSSPAAPGVLLNDTDPNSDTLTALLVSGPAHGTLTLNTNGSFSYRPFLNYNGTDSFTYKARDGALDSNEATVSFTITPVNDGPATVADSYTTAEDTILVVAAPGVRANDADPEGDPFTIYRSQNATNGTVVLNNDGSFTYTPNKDFNGVDTFTYQAYDDKNVFGPITTVTINVTPVNDAPVAANESYLADQNQTLTITVPAGTTSIVMTSDAGDYIGQGKSYNLTPAIGAIGLGGTTSVSMGYTSYANSSDYFTFQFAPPSGQSLTTGTYLNATRFGSATNPALQITGQGRGCNTISGQFTVTQIVRNDAGQVIQFAVDFEQHCEGGTPALRGTAKYDYTPSTPGVLFNDRDVDKDTLTATRLSGPAHGTLTLNANGTFTYVPTTGFFGYDSFDYQASDGKLTSNTATATIKVRPPGTAPVAANDSYTTNEDTDLTPASPGVLVNDSDAENETLSAVLIGAAKNGTVTLNADGTFRYTPNRDFNGTDSFTYRVDDPWREGNVATVTITVNPVNDAPLARNDFFSGTEEITLNISAPGVLREDTDAELTPLTAVLVSNPANGTLTFNSNGSFSYVPQANFAGTDTFTYQASDGQLLSNIATVTLFITNVNDPPTVTTSAGPLGYVTGQGATPLDAGITIADIDSPTLSGAIVQITGNYVRGEDVLAFTNTAQITGVFDDVTGKLTLSGQTALANFQAALRAVTYTNTSNNPAPVTRTVTITVNDGTPGSGGTGNSTGSGTRAITVTTADLNWNGGSLSGPATVLTNASFTLNRTYTLSSAGAPRDFRLAYYASTDTTFGNADDLLLGVETLSAPADLSLGAHTGISPLLQIATPGSYYLFARLDDSSVVIESNETNNVVQSTQVLNVSNSLVMDDLDAGYSETGTWTGYNVAGGFNGDYRYSLANQGPSTATWQFTGLAPGTYEIQATWIPFGNRATNAPFQLFDGSTLRLSLNVNQEQPPAGGTNVNGTPFKVLGTVSVTSGTLKVVLGNNADEYVIADAVRVAVGNLDTTPPSVSDRTPTANATIASSTVNLDVTFSETVVGVDATDLVLSGTAAAAATVGTPTNLMGNTWRFPVAGLVNGTLNVSLAPDADDIEDVVGNDLTPRPTTWSYTVALPPPTASTVIVEDGDPGYSETGTWTVYDQAGGYNNDYRYSLANQGPSSATWQVTGLAAGSYEVQATWVPFSNRATNAPFALYDGNTLVLSVNVNQELAPTGGVTAGGRPFQILGTVSITSGTLRVVLGNNANEYVIADAVRVAPTQTQDVTPPQVLTQTPAANATLTATSVNIDVTFSETVVGVDATDLVLSGTAAASATVGTPTNLTGNTWRFPVSGLANGSLNVSLAPDANDIEDPAGNDLSPRPTTWAYTVTLASPSVVIVEDGDPGYSETGTWTVYNQAGGYNNDYRYSLANQGPSSATWQVTGLAAGSYEVQATWVPFSNRATNAPFALYDGNTLVLSVNVNQELAPTGGVTAGGRPFQVLGTVSISSGTLRVVLGNNANEYVIADAVRIARVGAAGGSFAPTLNLPPATLETAALDLVFAAAPTQDTSSLPDADLNSIAADVARLLDSQEQRRRGLFS